MSISDKQFDALLAELVGIRKALDSFNRSFAEASVDTHDDLQDLVSSVDSLGINETIKESIINELSELSDDED